jgi:hypothetical protein
MVIILSNWESRNVKGFHHTELQDIPVANAATASDAPWDESLILLAHEVLLFGDTMKTSLLPPAAMPFVRGYNCAQIFFTAEYHCKTYSMKSKSEAYKTLDDYCATVGIANPVVTDNAGEANGMDWQRVIKKYLIKQKRT